METPEQKPRPRSEALDIVQTVVAALNDVITALRNEVRALGEGERDSRRRLYALLGSVAFLAALSLGGIAINYHQGQNVKRIVEYVSDCQDPQGKCKTEQNTQVADIIRNIGKLNFDSQACVLKVVPEKRTDAVFAECRERYFGK